MYKVIWQLSGVTSFRLVFRINAALIRPPKWRTEVPNSSFEIKLRALQEYLVRSACGWWPAAVDIDSETSGFAHKKRGMFWGAISLSTEASG
jgi:hypothetical protein